MKKLLPIVFLVALGLFFNLDSFAQQGSKVNVANNNELIKALENPNVTSIVITQDGYYDAIDNTAFEGNVIVKSGNGRGANSCTLSITKTDACFVSTTEPNFATAATSGDPSCPDQPDATSDPTGLYGWSVYTSDGTGAASFDMTAMADLWDYNAVFNVTASGKFTLTYKWDAFNETTINVYIYDTPDITITNSATSCEDILFTYTYDFGFSAAETFVTWTITDDASTTVDVTPNSNPASEVTAATFTFDPAAFPTLSSCGAYTLNVTSSNSTGCGTNVDYDFYLYDTPTGVTAGSDQTEVCEVAPDIYSTSVTGGFTTVSCGNGATPSVAWTHTGGTGAGTITFGTATDNTTTVSSDMCGEYTLTYTVTNGDCSASDEVTVTFVALPTLVNAGSDQDVCEDPTNGYVTVLGGSFTEALCNGSSTVMWTQYSGPGTAAITDETTLTPSIDAPMCGTYVFQMDVTNGTACSVSSTVTVDFYDLATLVNAGSDQDICEDATTGAYVADLLGSYTDVSCGTTTIEWTYTTISGGGTLSFDDATINNPVATATLCGEYLVTYTITTVGASSCSVEDQVTLKFYDLADNVVAGNDKDVCSLTTTLAGTYDALSCGTAATVQWSKYSGPGGVIFDPVNADVASLGVTVDQCGEYVFEFDVTNENDCTVSSTITVFFTDEPTFVKDGAYPIPDTICGYTSNEFYLSYTADCMSTTNSGTFTAETGNATITETSVGSNMWIAALGTGDVCGDYDFKYTVINGVCSVDTTITITFFDTPDLTVNTAGDVYTCSTVTYDVTNAACIVPGQVVDYVWDVTGGTLSGTTGTTVDVTWDMDDATDGYIAVTGTINGTDNGVCDATDDLTVDKKLPTLEGQIKYWNAFETYMPTPFPTDLYGTYPEDYFYVTLYHNGMTHMDSISTVYVQPRLMEDLNELMSYFDFEVNTTMYGCDAEYILKVWDGGLVYHNNPYPPANSPTYLGAAYTYNEWGGVNATDAYAIQLMAAASDLNASYPWVGTQSLTPAYGYYSNDIADVNTSGTSITALDALIVNYRAVGLLGSYPNAGSNQFSPNFAVTGRMVTTLPETTFSTTSNSYFDDDNVNDVAFSHSGEEYMYFDDAIDHKYTSDSLPLKAEANYINLYYEAEGDVNASYIPTSAGFKAQPSMELIYENLVGTQVDDVITIPVSVDRDAEVNAISLFLNYRNDLIEVIGTNYADENVLINQEEGILNIGWFSTDTRDVEEGEIIAQIQVRVLSEIPEGTELFELSVNTELADVTATPISDINLKTIGVTTDKVAFTGTELVASNYPNPLKNSTTITYTLPESGKVNVTVLNNMGVVVKTIVAEVQEAGTHSFVYNANIEAGIYFYSITLQGETNTYSTVERMIVVN